MEGEMYVDPVSGATIFDDGAHMMPGGEGEYSPDVDSDGRGDVFGVLLPEEAAAFVPQATSQAAVPAPAPPAPAAQPADVQAIERASEVALHAAARASEEGRMLYTEATGRAQRVADRRAQAEREWTEGGVTPESITKFVIEQDQDSRAAAHHMSQAQAKMNEARAYGTTAEAAEMWATIRGRFPRINEGSPGLGRLASDLWTLRQASRFARPYTELLEEHLEGIRSHLGASAPPSSAPAAAPGGRLSVDDARTFGLA